MKYIAFVLDGAADKGLDALHGKTPFERAAHPFLNALCAAGQSGLVRCIPEGLPAGTETAFITLLGGDANHVGRAYLEAAGMGLELSEDEKALRASFISIDENYCIASHNADGLSREEGDALLCALRENPLIAAQLERMHIRLLCGQGFRHIWAFSGDKKVPVCRAPHEIIGQPYYEHLPESWAHLLVQMAQVLADHAVNEQRRSEGRKEANMLWPWAAGNRPVLPDFAQRFGLRGACVAAAPVVKGAARLAGLFSPDIEGASGDLHTSWQTKADTALALLEKCDFVLLHLEAPDECAHEGDAAGKVQAIAMGGEMLASVCNGLEHSANGRQDYRLLVFSDHYTFTQTRAHGDAPTPYFLYDSRQSAAAGCGLPFYESAIQESDPPVLVGENAFVSLLERDIEKNG